MSNIREILSSEHSRTEMSSCRVIHLYLEGSFLRAYDWSAWLCCRIVHPFKVTNRLFKGMDVATTLIGFPPSSLDKFKPADAELKSIDVKIIAKYTI